MREMPAKKNIPAYFADSIQISAETWNILKLDAISGTIRERNLPRIIFYRELALAINSSSPPDAPPVHASSLNMYATLLDIFRYILNVFAESETPGFLHLALSDGQNSLGMGDREAAAIFAAFTRYFPPADVVQGKSGILKWLSDLERSPSKQASISTEMVLLELASENRAIDSFRQILDDTPLAEVEPAYGKLVSETVKSLEKRPVLQKTGTSLMMTLRAPLLASPGSLSDQLDFIRREWIDILPEHLRDELLFAFDILHEEERSRGFGGGPGPMTPLQFGNKAGMRDAAGMTGDGSSVFGGYDYPEYERFSPDTDWMSNVVLMAKMVYVWLYQLSREYGRTIERLDQIPDAELDRLEQAGFTGLWLIGIWERSPASAQIKHLCGNPDAIASAYSLYDYEIAADLGGWDALSKLREQAMKKGIRLASDMVPNHTGIYSRWVIEHPDWFIQTDHPPFPGYSFTGENLSHSDQAVIQIEDGYWTKSDAAVVFRYIERKTGRIRYIYHGNDGTSIPWNDTAQLNYLLPDLREAVIKTIIHIARNFPIIRFDAAMTLAKKHYQRLWFPIRGVGGGIPSRSEWGMTRKEFDSLFPVEFWREVVDRVEVEAPGTLLLAEAFWMMEGYFVRTLGMHRVYNSAFMNMLKMEENAKYRKTIANVLELNPQILKRFVNFMNNPDEKSAAEQFGSQGKYFGACLLMATMPGLPMFGHGQIEGFHEKYGMEYKRAYWDETPDKGLILGHEMWIFPALRLRWLFSGSENFALYDFTSGDHTDENVFAYSNRYGEERALVIYNNRHATTSGWINISVPYAVGSGDAGDMKLQRTKLSEALGIPSEERFFCSFRDAISNLQFLRDSRELSSNGLFAELGEYEFHLFLEFRLIRDDDDLSWEKLCRALEGSGVENLEEERKQLRFSSLNLAFERLLTSLSFDATCMREESDKEKKEIFSAAIADLSTHLESADPSPAEYSLPTSEAIAGAVNFLADTRATKSGKKPHAVKEVEKRLTGPFGRELLAAYLIFSGHPGFRLSRFGLDRKGKGVVRRTGDEDVPFPIDLLDALLDLSGEPFAKGEDIASTLARAFSSDSCRRFMNVHTADETEWLNKERFEELALWLLVARVAENLVKTAGMEAEGKERVKKARGLKRPAMKKADSGSETFPGAKSGAIFRDIGEKLEDMATITATSGYRTSLLVPMLEKSGSGSGR